jgi:mono/diheme cytochrome c family protein
MDPKGAGSELQESRGAAPLLLGITLVALSFPGPAAVAAPPAQPVGYARDVAPILARWCVGCHGGREPHAGLSLDSYVGVLRGGDTGPVVISGDPDGSLLVAKIERRDRPAMPPRRKLPAAAVRLIRAWIAAGAPG